MRIGAVSYLNTKPLVYGLQQRAPLARLTFDLPSRLADQLAAGLLDAALIPSIEYFQNPNYVILSDACIGCRGPVLSVKLLSCTPMHQIRTLALDEGSRTSAALAQILLHQRYNIRPAVIPFPVDASPDSVRADALLMIGDRAMHPPQGFSQVWDLGDEWLRFAELPFVFAMWVADADVVNQPSRREEFAALETALGQARDAGVEHLPEIAAPEALRVGLSFDQTLVYLRDNLYFFLGPRELAGLKLFYHHACRLGLAPPEHTIARFAAAN